MPHVFDGINDVYWAHDSLYRGVIDEHFPLKLKKRRKHGTPFMNSELRKAINFIKALRRKYLNNKCDKNWSKFAKQRNLVTKLKRQSIKLYFAERCGGGTKTSDFWPTIRPFLTNKGSQNSENIATYQIVVISLPIPVKSVKNLTPFSLTWQRILVTVQIAFPRRTTQVSVRSGQTIHPLNQSLILSLWMKLGSHVTWGGLAGERQLD